MKFNFKLILFYTVFILLFLFTKSIYAQKYELNIIPSDSSSISFIKKKSFTKTFNDSIQLNNELTKIRSKLFSKGYITASLDSLIFDSLIANAYFFIGEKFQIIKINAQGIDDRTIRKLNIPLNKNKTTNPIELIQIYERIIKYYENNAYPFAHISPRNIEILNGNIILDLSIKKNKHISINKVIIKGTDKIPKTFIKHYISIFEEDYYNEKLISEISSKIQNLSFISEIRKPELEFITNKANLYLYLKKKKANLFNGIIGFIPEKENNYKLSFTGDVNLKLINNFSKGEDISLNWSRTKKLSQKLSIKSNIPYVFKSPFGINLKFKLDKKDTTYMTIKSTFGFDYSFKNNDKIFAYAKKVNSYILSSKYTDTTLYANINSFAFGLSYKTEKINYLFNPSKGYFFFMDITSGKKKINSIESNYVNTQLLFDLYTPLINKFVLKTSLTNNYLFSKTSLFQNEMFKIGGFNSIRGFDEDAFYSSGYSILSNEIRFLYEKNSNVYIFSDVARTIKNKNNEIYLFGFGIGTNFATKAGIFSVAYALGKFHNEIIQLSSSKIHIGYINKF